METLVGDSETSKLAELKPGAGAVDFADGVGEGESSTPVKEEVSSEVVEAGKKENGGDGVAKMDEEELDEGDDVDDDEEENVFSVGEFVWGKIKHHPWWPGQIYDASDASELALKHKPKDKDPYLVAYFGDGTFSWCSGAQLKRFDDSFQALSRQSGSKGFLYAVEDALSMVGDLVALEMTCSCVLKDGQAGFVRPVAENAGIRKGVLVPMVGVDRLAVAQFDAAAAVASVRNAARSVAMTNRLELTMLNSKLSAFYRAKGYSELPKYYFPVYIDGLEDVNKSDVVAEASVDGLVKDEDGETPLEKAPALAEDKLYGRRKQKSLSDIIREETFFDPQCDKEEKETPPSRQGTRRRKRAGQTDSHEKGSQSSLTKVRKKAKSSSSQKSNSDEDIKPPGGDSDSVEVDVAVRSKGRKRVATTSGEKEGAGKSRDKKRKKDSPTRFASIKQLGFEPVLPDLQTDTRVGERMSKAAKLIIESPSIRKQCSIVFEKESAKKCSIKDEEPESVSDPGKKQGEGGSDIDPMAKEMISSGIKSATVGPLQERPFGSKLDVFSLNKVSNYDTIMGEEEDDDDGRPMSAILFLTFSDGVSLPSKADLVAKYSRFGSLNEDETDVLPNSLCAQVVFIRKSEGEQAFDDMVRMNSADSGVQYRIRYVPRGSKIRELDGSVRPKASPQSGKVHADVHSVSVDYVRQKLETMMSKLNNLEGEDTLSFELKNELHREIRDLLEKLSSGP